jgi:hypothetical protein
MESFRALDVYRQHQKKCGKIVGRPQPFHRCSEKCSFFEVAGLSIPYFVCKASLNVHTHGSDCQEDTGDYIVCKYTGHVINSLITTDPGPIRPSKDNPNRMINVHHVWSPVKRAGKRSVDRKLIIVESLMHLMYSSDRHTMYRDQQTRFKQKLKSVMRTSTNRYSDMVLEFCKLRRDFGLFMNECPRNNDKQFVVAVASKFDTYFDAIYGYFPKDVKLSQKLYQTFTAFMMSRLTTGLVIDNIQVIEKHAFFTRYGVAELQYSLFRIMNCKRLNDFAKKFHKACYKNNEVNGQFQFKLTDKKIYP